MRLQDPVFAQRVRSILKVFDAYMNQQDTWASHHAPAFAANPVAYFTAEYGFHETLPIAAGGLGILSGDHARSASDLGLGFVGVSLFYREGYFQQSMNRENWQTEYYTPLNPELLPLEPVLTETGERLVCQVEINLAQVYFQAWKVNVGRCPVYLLDSNRPENEPLHRDLTLHVYGGDRSTRVMQELLSGIGRRPPSARPGYPAVSLSHERRPCRFCRTGIDPGKNKRRVLVRRSSRPHSPRNAFSRRTLRWKRDTTASVRS